eukprot:366566-Chlamydomonas_euryale.AAC.13
MATTRWLVSCQAVCQQLCLPTLAFKATDLCQLLKDAIAPPDLLLATAAAAASDGRGRLRHDVMLFMLFMRSLAGGSTSSTPSDQLDPLNSDI